jgi:CYTH domain-containing protein
VHLDEPEYTGLLALDGVDLAKTRYHQEWHGSRFAVDVFEGALAGLVSCEIEADSRDELMAIAFPPWAYREVTADPFFTGRNLCDVTADELRLRLNG